VKLLAAARTLPEDVEQDSAEDDAKRAMLEDEIAAHAAARAERLEVAEKEQAAAARLQLLVDAIGKDKEALEKEIDPQQSERLLADVAAKHSKLNEVTKATEQIKRQIENLQQSRTAKMDQLMAAEGEVTEVRGKAKEATGQDGPDKLAVWASSERDAQAHISGLRKKLESAKKRHGNVDFDEIKDAYLRAETEAASARKSAEDVAGLLDKLRRAKATSIKQFKSMRDDAARVAKEDFIQRMRDKGHAAQIDFEHGGPKGHKDLRDLGEEEGEIRLKCKMDGYARGADIASVAKDGLSQASFSGGEKSYTGNALLSSIAKVAAAPFRIVDEFDVFQDETTRKKTLQALIDDAQVLLPGSAQDGGGTLAQYILLTPHDISSVVVPGEHIKVHRLADPQKKED
jgi:chromosome segregation ATPase